MRCSHRPPYAGKQPPRIKIGGEARSQDGLSQQLARARVSLSPKLDDVGGIIQCCYYLKVRWRHQLEATTISIVDLTKTHKEEGYN
jgi:hypothetical protein